MADLVADADEALCLFIGIPLTPVFLLAVEAHADRFVVHLTDVVQVHGGDDGVAFVHVALGVEVRAEARADEREAAPPNDLGGGELALVINEP